MWLGTGEGEFTGFFEGDGLGDGLELPAAVDPGGATEPLVGSAEAPVAGLIVTWFITTGSVGFSPSAAAAMASATSMPFVTVPMIW